MVAVLRALPDNPVPVFMPSVGQSATTRIEWDTDNSQVLAQLFHSANGGAFARADAAPPARRGAIPSFTVKLGDQNVFELRRVPGGAVLAQLVVATREVNPLHEQIIGWVRPRIVLNQAIYGLRVEPGVESVRVRFRTRQPTAPILVVREAEDNRLAGSTLGPKRDVHDITVAIGRDPTPQAVTYHLTVSALSTEGEPTTAEARVLFITGTRRATVFFDRLKVHRDGDPGWYLADGDFQWAFRVGEVGSLVSSSTSFFRDTIGDNEIRGLDRALILDPAPPAVWVQAAGTESDGSWFELSFASFGAADPNFYQPDGVIHYSGDEYEEITITRSFDLTERADTQDDLNFTLETGPLVFSATVFCRLRVETQPGAVIQPAVTRRGPAVAYVPGPVQRLGPGGLMRTSATGLLLRGPLGELLAGEEGGAHRPTRWREIAPMRAGELMAVLGGRAPQLFALADDGRVETLADGEWASLGGGFVKLLAVAGEGEPHLFGLDRAGGVHHRRGQADGGSDWRHMAEGVAGDLNAFAHGDCVRLVARGEEREVLYLASTEAGDWTRLGYAPEGRLIAASTGDGLAFAVLRDDETIALAISEDPPGRLEWVEAGDLTRLLDRRFSLAASTAKPPSADRPENSSSA